MYYEDMDYSLRILENKFNIFYEKNAKVYHKVGRTAGVNSKLAIYYNVRNRFYVINKLILAHPVYILPAIKGNQATAWNYISYK